MKKRLEAELISIAHRILKLKNKSEVDQLYKETQKLYETLTVLKFYGDNFETVKAEIPVDVMEEKLTNSFESEEPITIELEVPAVAEVIEEIELATEETIEVEDEVKIIEEEDEETETDTISEAEEVEEDEVDEPIAEMEEVEEEIIEDEAEKSSDEPDFKPAFEFTVEDESEEEEEETEHEIISDPSDSDETKQTKQIAFEDFLGENYADPVFVKPNEVSSPSNSLFSTQESAFESNQPKIVALNDTMSKTISIGLNDRIGFVKFLFADSNEDYNRVLSQLSTFDTFEEAENFINDMVKPDYNNWEGKDDYAERFMEIVEQKFV